MSNIPTILVLFLFAGVQMSCAQDLVWPQVLKRIRSSYPEVRQISVDSLAAWLNDPRRPAPVLLDVREPEEYAVSHLRGAIRVDPDTDDLSVLAGVDRDTPIVTYCSVGYRSSALAEKLMRAGFTNVANLEGSIFAWANRGHPVYDDGHRAEYVHPYDAIWGKLLDPALRYRGVR